MSTKAIAIVGAGLAGLAAGVYAQINGYRTHIFEHGSQPGGVAAWWRRGSYHVDGGIHFLMGHRSGGALHELYRQLGTAAPDTLMDMAEYGRFVDEASGKSVLMTTDLAQCAAVLKGLSPADAGATDAGATDAAIDDLIAGARAFSGRGLHLTSGWPIRRSWQAGSIPCASSGACARC